LKELTYEKDTLIIVVPCYNEEECLPHTIKALSSFISAYHKCSDESQILFVDDGSSDRTWEIIESASRKAGYICGTRLTRNCGHQNALLCGLREAAEMGDVVISIDADLQDDISVIPEMLDKYYAGADIVCGVRKSRKTDSFMKRFTAESYYKLLKFLGVNVIYNHADFRLMSREAINDLLSYNESNLFLRGLIPMLGRRIEAVYYDRKKRDEGQTKYTLRKMLKLSFDGITSFSVAPIRLIMLIGFLMFFISVGFDAYFIIGKLCGQTVDGWASVMVSLWTIGGINLMAIGVIGEYVGKTYMETKRRPRYKVWERTK
jgi:glycosyltransferase involved in cell wall biosynthesis